MGPFSVHRFAEYMANLGLVKILPGGLLQLCAFAIVGLGCIALMTWDNYSRPAKDRWANENNPVQILWVFEILTLVVIGEWITLLLLADGQPVMGPRSI